MLGGINMQALSFFFFLKIFKIPGSCESTCGSGTWLVNATNKLRINTGSFLIFTFRDLDQGTQVWEIRAVSGKDRCHKGVGGSRNVNGSVLKLWHELNIVATLL